ncbi:hypothetical protein PFAG_05458 [Plasmodium falciparum Santa Lucia]|uniref:Uncharacterized protein n=4 Tax=Plasmodium falciparum TaxID=5833 RepID=W4IVI7_PLAFP|nr:hypothetical protein PFTANZ_06011 [Plasmodium falciparum Tanzania (2000708)]ETW54023.1 hypothetical protein PFUGPA_03895 [Plasmodium falciparum Palo Alto/Uganda]EUR62821.1 hypothetical protein PFBG_05426 [Plasmodium falciparum 7G8]EUT78882.1 hypothetical protein PFAG_05458 [Plasmodium falciparum Santa Lucia]
MHIKKKKIWNMQNNVIKRKKKNEDIQYFLILKEKKKNLYSKLIVLCMIYEKIKNSNNVLKILEPLISLFKMLKKV